MSHCNGGGCRCRKQNDRRGECRGHSKSCREHGDLPDKIGASAGGLTVGLLASAADDAVIGSAVGAALGSQAQVGVAVVSAVGAGVGYLAAEALSHKHQNSGNDDGESGGDILELGELYLDDDESVST